MKNLKEEIILLGPQDNPWLILSIEKALIILDLMEQCKNQEQLNVLNQLLNLGENASLDTLGRIYAILYKVGVLTLRSKYEQLDVIESTFEIKNVRLEFMSIIDKFKLRKR